ncbi:MAG TPA: GntR family transcriptional regulator [Intrasporangium sp.]|uniref:GntR family transcriptional regulator n=1 Tax=Intrasporangium sp. TaxID=1925024 RepID=UPI002D77226E|nr:GntR family transcriptional regulator [Intrasporangium sp.]HET7397010.1 GntR family transcriptional regulator [Intrasporangium sp.]
MTQPRRQSGIVSLLVRQKDYVSGPEVLTELRRVIASGAVPPGSPIPLDDVAAFFGVSLIPVREALKTLLGEGLLAHQPRLGYTVTALSAAELHELYVVRGALEAAALDGAVRQATAVDHARARAVHERLAACLSAGDIVGFQRASRDFHEALLASCRMPRLLHMLDIAWNLTEPVQTMMRVTDEERLQMQVDHQEMLEAFVAGDAASLRSAAEAHHDRLTACIARIGDA